jgi:hypothetical protein
MLKKIAAFLFILLMWTGAASGQNPAVKNLDTSQWPQILLTAAGSDPDKTAGSWSLNILPDGPELPAVSLADVPSAETGSLHLVVALDTSKSFSAGKLAAAKEALINFSGQLAPEDQLALIVFNDSVQIASGFSSNRAGFNQAVSSLALTGSKTELYRALLYSFDLLKNIPGQRTLLVISDGQDEGAGVSQMDVLSSGTANGIRILSILLADSAVDPRHQIFMEKLASETNGQFWRVDHPQSLSMAIYDVLKKKSSQPAPETAFTLTFNVPEGFEPRTKELEAVLRKKTGDGALTWPLILQVPEDKVKAPEPPAEPEPEPKSIAGAEPEAEPEGNWFVRKYHEQPAILIMTAASILLLAVILILVLTKMKKNRPASFLGTGERTVILPGRPESSKTVRIPNPQAGSPYVLEFMDMNLSFPLKLGTVTLGAAPQNDVIIEIATVSGRHAEFQVSPESCRIKDLNSTNGTQVNGTPITQFAALRIGDILKFGTASAMLTRR